MKWVDKKPDISSKPVAEVFSGLSVLSILELISSSVECPHVFMSDTVKKTVMDHITCNQTESGGLLVGEVISLDSLDSGVVAVHVTTAIPSQEFDATSVSLSMGPAVWDAARSYITNDNFVIGWYHSHPNLGAFFSGTDRKTQAEFFNKKYHLGLVIDPIRDEELWFVGRDSLALPVSHMWGDFDELAVV
ncbi:MULTISPECIES: Mov34/MPN/PAD-1 family protein [Vibrio harveyi group]|uniref:Mov34/MPN/PAD-1 family protein n=1 Tax=Vibrio harveyi group TaxID=717610 RepID=UPI001BD6A200|nr:Mov34/MPN/PAD-1 family protein [Vibrio alginolyticus]MBT0032530.1 Mov34/MPN/PAD-1 family protein [Vibrio alginolyticus]MBY4650371.1 Mov34/MPN/PAD-1 family protein [Vibrio alginolyticus]